MSPWLLSIELAGGNGLWLNFNRGTGTNFCFKSRNGFKALWTDFEANASCFDIFKIHFNGNSLGNGGNGED